MFPLLRAQLPNDKHTGTLMTFDVGMYEEESEHYLSGHEEKTTIGYGGSR